MPRKPTVLPDMRTPDAVRGLASWLRAAAGARSKVELAPSTAYTIADLLEASVNTEQRSAA